MGRTLTKSKAPAAKATGKQKSVARAAPKATAAAPRKKAAPKTMAAGGGSGGGTTASRKTTHLGDGVTAVAGRKRASRA